MTTMLKELTLDGDVPTLAVLGSKDAGGKLMIGITEHTVASERYNAVDLPDPSHRHSRRRWWSSNLRPRRWFARRGALGCRMPFQQLGLHHNRPVPSVKMRHSLLVGFFAGNHAAWRFLPFEGSTR